jgi:hypothetical protein
LGHVRLGGRSAPICDVATVFDVKRLDSILKQHDPRRTSQASAPRKRDKEKKREKRTGKASRVARKRTYLPSLDIHLEDELIHRPSSSLLLDLLLVRWLTR